ncbi:hypothetical protein ACLOJK_019550 [Asimina triloba]
MVDNHYDDLLYHLTLYQDTPTIPATVTQELPNSASITTQLSIELTHDTETMLQDFNAPPSSARLRPMPDLMIEAQQIDDDDELHQIRRVPLPTSIALTVLAASSSATATHHRRKFRWTIQSIQLDNDDELSRQLHAVPMVSPPSMVDVASPSADRHPFQILTATSSSTIFRTTPSEDDPVTSSSNGDIIIFFVDDISTVDLSSSRRTTQIKVDGRQRPGPLHLRWQASGQLATVAASERWQLEAGGRRRWLYAGQASDSSCDAWLWADAWPWVNVGGGFHDTHMGVPSGRGHGRRWARSPSSLQADMSLD